MGTHPIFESDFDCLTEMSNSGLTSPRGLPESNGRAVISALRTLQNKIRDMEMAKAASEASSKSTPRSKITMVRHEGTNTPRSLLDEENQNPNSTPQMKRIISSRRSNSIGTDSDASVSIQRSRSDHNLIRTESSKRSKELEYELSMADERCKLLEDRLNQMRDAFARSENERNRQLEARIRSERERVAKEYEESVTAESIPKLRLPFPSATAGDSDEEFISCRDHFVKPDIINPSVDDVEDDSDLELEEVNLKFKTSPRSMSNQKEKHVQIKVPTKQKIPFCAARSTQPSHNVGLNIQGLLHQLKTKNKKSGKSSKISSDVPIQATSESSNVSRHKLQDEIKNPSRRRSKSVDSNRNGDSTYRLNKGKETVNFPLSIKPNNLLHHIDNLKELLAQLQSEFGDITLSCRRTDLEVDDLQQRLGQLEKKGQQIIVVKKLLKKKEENLQTKSSTISSRNKSNLPPRSSSSSLSGGVKTRHNRVLLREVKKIKNQLQ